MGAFYIARKVAFMPSKYALPYGIKTRLARGDTTNKNEWQRKGKVWSF